MKAPLQIQTNLLRKLGFFVFSLFLFHSTVHAQTANDPLKKPAIWSQLKADPENDKLWGQYFGKDWSSLSESEEDSMMVWKNALIKNKKREYDPAYAKYKAEMNKQLKEYLDCMNSLKSNINANFVIIEEMFHIQFQNFGKEYKYYDEVYPDGKYNKVQWVEKHDEEVIKFKRLAIEQ